jgi:hypothetical protein
MWQSRPDNAARGVRMPSALEVSPWLLHPGGSVLNRRQFATGEVVNGGLRDKAIAENLTTQGIVPRLMTAPEYRAFVVSEAEKFGQIVTQANIKLQN